MLLTYAVLVSIVAAGLLLEWWGRKKLERRRREEMKKAANRPASMETWEQAVSRFKAENPPAHNEMLRGDLLQGHQDYFEFGRKLATVRAAQVEGFCEYCGSTGKCSICGSDHGDAA